MEAFLWCKRFITESFEGKVFYWVPVCVAFGILLYFCLPHEPSLSICLFFTLFLGMICADRYKRQRYTQLSLFGVLGFIVLGVTLVTLRTQSLDTTFIEKDGLYQVEAEIENILPYEKGQRVILSPAGALSINNRIDIAMDGHRKSYRNSQYAFNKLL